MNEKTIYMVFFPILCFGIFIGSNPMFAQPLIAWEKSYGGSAPDYAESILQTEDGGFLITAHSESDDGDFDRNYGEADLWVIKTDANGEIEWKKNYGGSAWDESVGVVNTQDNDFLIAGVSASNDGDLPGNYGWTDVWVLKIDKSGNLLWSRIYGGSQPDFARDLIKTRSNSYLLVGSTWSDDGDIVFNKGELDAWLLEIDGDGEILRNMTFGGSKSDQFGDVEMLQDNSYLLTGHTNSDDGDIPGNKGDYDAWALKINEDASIKWSKTFGGSKRDWFGAILEKSNNRLLLSGTSKSIDGDINNFYGETDIWILETDLMGNILLSRKYGGSKSDGGAKSIFSSDGNIMVFGDSFSSDGQVSGNYGNISHGDIWLFEINNSGELIWEKNYGGSKHDIGTNIIDIPDGYLLLGSSESEDYDVSKNNGRTDVWLAKLIFPPEEGEQDCYFNAYPNPMTSDDLTIAFDFPVLDDLVIVIYDSTGRLIMEQNETNTITTEIELNFPNLLVSGIYILKVMCQDQAHRKKIIKIN